MIKRYLRGNLKLILIGAAMLAALPAGVGAQSSPPMRAENMAAGKADTPAGKVDVKLLVIEDLKHTREKIVSLAQAMPEDKYSWTPGPGVRSVGEVYMHIARANFTFPTIWGMPPPPAKDLGRIPYPKKERVIQLLNLSFDFLQNRIEKIPDAQLSQSRDFFGQQIPLAGILIIIAGHEHEHLGQSIAYARMNGVVPPWSAPAKPAPAEQTPKQ